MFLRFIRVTIWLILVVTILRVLMFPSSEPLTFTGLLHFLQDVETIKIPFLAFENVSTGNVSGCAASWANFINSIKSIINLLIFVVNGLLSVVQLIIPFMQYIYTF